MPPASTSRAPDRLVPRGTPESRAFAARVAVAVAASERLSRLPYADGDGIRAAWSELTGQAVDRAFALIPPVHCDHGLGLRVGTRVFINRNCTLMDFGGIDIGDRVLIGPNVSLISCGHPVEPAERRDGITVAPIRIEHDVWIGAGATILQGVTVGAHAVVAAGAVVTGDVPPRTLVAGVPARVVRALGASTDG